MEVPLYFIITTKRRSYMYLLLGYRLHCIPLWHQEVFEHCFRSCEGTSLWWWGRLWPWHTGPWEWCRWKESVQLSQRNQICSCEQVYTGGGGWRENCVTFKSDQHQILSNVLDLWIYFNYSDTLILQINRGNTGAVLYRILLAMHYDILSWSDKFLLAAILKLYTIQCSLNSQEEFCHITVNKCLCGLYTVIR